MKRIKSYSEKKESILDHFLDHLRFKEIVDNIPDNSNVLDLGSGFNGAVLKRLNNKISSGIGIDISVNNEYFSNKIKLFKHDLNTILPFRDNEFDIVISLAVIEHLNEYNLHIQESLRVLKKGGKMILTTPDPKSEKILLVLAKIGLISKEEIMDHKKYFDKASLKSLFTCAKFRYMDIKSFQLGFNNLVIAQK